MKNRGFTLVELLVAISIIATLTAIIVPNFMGARERARDAQRIQDMRALKDALRLYYNDHQSYPASANMMDEVAPYLPNSQNLESIVGDIRYQVDDSGDKFRAYIDLESGSGDEDGQSQEECWWTTDTDTTPEERVYAVCAQ